MQVKIEKMDYKGRRITHINNKVIFVDKAVTEDILDIEITKEYKKYDEAKIKKIVKPSIYRTHALCPFYNTCGGCSIQNLNYENTLKYKKSAIIEIFKGKGFEIEPIFISNKSPLYYRNKIELQICDKKVGFYEKKTNDIVEISRCITSSKIINEIIKIIPSLNIINGKVIIRSNKKEDVLIIINSKDNLKIDLDNIKNNRNIVGVILNNKTIYGRNYLIENINDLSYKISYDSFFQINPYIASRLFSIIKDNINKGEKVLDLYCGVGTLSLNASLNASEVLGIEVIPNAILNANYNAKKNNITNTKFILGDVNDIVGGISKKIDTIILDPPRSGISNKVISLLKSTRPNKIIYVSCNPLTLVRDLDNIKDIYILERIYLLDMFSYTYHIECVVILYQK